MAVVAADLVNCVDDLVNHALDLVNCVDDLVNRALNLVNHVPTIYFETQTILWFRLNT